MDILERGSSKSVLVHLYFCHIVRISIQRYKAKKFLNTTMDGDVYVGTCQCIKMNFIHNKGIIKRARNSCRRAKTKKIKKINNENKI